MTGSSDWPKFSAIYNNVEKYPSLTDVGMALDIRPRTVRERAETLRKLREKDSSLPELVRRSATVKKVENEEDDISEAEVADTRAEELAKDLLSVVTASKYPVINPEAIVVESHMPMAYSKSIGERVAKAGTPRTWMNDTLRVKSITRNKNRKFIFTGAQNDTDLHPIWPNLVAYAKFLKADLIVGPGTYETQWWSENNPAARSYAAELTDHLCFGQMQIGDNFVFCGEMNILPTASAPINDLVTYTRGRWGVFPHAKRQLKSVPSTDPKRQAHQVMTTGLCTKPKVVPRKAGIKSIFHHVAGAVIVEFDKDGDVFCRHITAGKDGSFYDLDARVQGGKVKIGQLTIRYLTLPDVHAAKLGPKNAASIFGIDIVSKKRLKNKNAIDMLKPEMVFVHDVFDNQTRNHHNDGDNSMNYELAYGNKDNVLDEIKGVASFLDLLQRPWMQIFVVESNHDLALERYVREGRYRMDGKNIRLGLQLEDAYLEYRERVRDALDAFQPTPKFSVLEHAIRRLSSALTGVKWIYDGDSFKVDGVECGHHGFRGANGAKGTVAGFARLGIKMSIGDKHSPEINEGVFCDGVTELQHGYNKGPSGWAVTLTAQYKDGKRTLITLQNGKLRA